MSPIPKHLRPRYRYLALTLTSWPDATITKRVFQRALWQTARSLIGDTGSARTDLKVIRFTFTDTTGTAIIRTQRETVSDARATIACITTIENQPIGVFVTGISGTVRACEEKYLGKHPEPVHERQVAFKDASRTAFIRGDRADIRMNNAFTGATKLDFD